VPPSQAMPSVAHPAKPLMVIFPPLTLSPGGEHLALSGDCKMKRNKLDIKRKITFHMSRESKNFVIIDPAKNIQ